MSETNLMALFPSTNGPPWALSLGKRTKVDSERIRLLSWLRICTSLSAAKRRGNLQIVELFLIRLLAEAAFDDEGAWLVPKTAHREQDGRVDRAESAKLNEKAALVFGAQFVHAGGNRREMEQISTR